MDILGTINRATELIDEGLNLYHSVKGQVDNGAADISADTLEEAKAALAGAIQRANAAHDSLEAAIAARLSQ